MPDKLKIFVIANNFWNLYNFRTELVVSLSNKYNVVLIGKFDGYQSHFTDFECHNINTDYNLFTFPRTIYKLFNIFRQNPGMKVVLSFTIKPNFLISIFTLFCQIIYLPNITGLGIVKEAIGLRRLLYITVIRLIVARASFIFFQNPDDWCFVRDFCNAYDKLVDILPGSGVPLPKPNNNKIRGKAVNIVFVGRLLKSKGVLEFYEAAQNQFKSGSKLNFTIIGKEDFSHRDSITRLQHDEIINSSSVTFKRNIDNVSNILVNEDVIVLLSTYGEGTPRSLLEGLASGLIILTSNTPGCRECVADGVNGYFVNSQTLLDYLHIIEKMSEREVIDMKKCSLELVAAKFDVNIVCNRYHRALSIIDKRIELN
jgi:glycosyltransferase involved in cell wall biosynthesis